MATAVSSGATMDGGQRFLRHPTLERGVFEQLQRNDVIEVRPKMLHFGGFQIHKQHSQRLRVINTSSSSLRVSIIGPSTPNYKIVYDKKGLLAPGMGEEITVVFEPHEWRYYFDTVKIFCGELGENLVVPIHGYPSANDLQLPKIVDFGRVPVGTSRTKVIPLTCKIPIQFEFQIEVLQTHPDFEVTPMSGVIPADGTTNVVVTFLPTKHRTARTELRFNVSQFDFEPVVVTVVGSSHPDLTHAEVLQSAESELVATAKLKLQEEMTAKTRSLKSKRSRAALEVKPPQFAVELAERTLDGVTVPTRFDHQSTAFVLSQKPGIQQMKSSRSQLKEGLGDSGAQSAELRFELQYREVAKYDKEKELNSRPAIGEDELSAEEKKAFQENRKAVHARNIEDMVRADVARTESVLKESEKIGVPTSFFHALKPDWDENNNDMFSLRMQVIDRFIRSGAKALMRMRVKRTIDALQEAMRAANVEDRESCRAWMDAEQRTAAAGGGGGESARGKKSSASSSTSRAIEDSDAAAGVVDFVKLGPGFVLTFQLPTNRAVAAVEDRQLVEVQPLDNFEEFSVFNISERLDWKVDNYPENPLLPDPAMYMRPNDSRVRLVAALEEHSIRGQRGDILDGAEKPLSMPETCLLPPAHEALSLMIPSPELRTYIGFPDFTECDTEYRLAQPPPVIEPCATEPLLPTDIMSLDTPWLNVWRPVRQIQDPFEHFDPFPCSFAEAGGSLGPRIGFDAGGERLSYLPAGGYARDIPSDTDDDDRDDFEDCQDTKPPPKEEYEKALEGLARPIISDRQRKEKAAEERLRNLCDERNRATREKMREFNKDLRHANKLYLG
eukprot:TRINITY_DN32553_c0_g1_i1.p1 TRINITY_DN32553_c0_g1~~TRINITY_DN32553_c0_g1_i1.p1  ORF type:complete len:867 (-),score=193.80 TRINITY_DN32553_c0_g1_i1:38-2557(-)